MNSKLQSFVHQAQVLEGNEVIDLIHKVLNTSGIYTFAELLAVPSIQKLSSTHPSIHKLLDIFAFGTLKDYKLHELNLPSLTPSALQKLRLLSLISLISSDHKKLRYDLLLKELQLSDIRTLEDLIIEGIYDNVLEGTLDQRNKELRVEWTLGRDVPLHHTHMIAESLRAWANTTQNVLEQLEQAFLNIKSVAQDYKLSKTNQKEHLEYLASRNKGKRPASIKDPNVA